MTSHVFATALLLLTMCVRASAQHTEGRLTDDEDATIPLWPRSTLDIRSSGGKVMGCLPKGEQSIVLQSAAAASIDAGWPPPEWAIELTPQGTPLVIHAGECLTFGSIPQGYRQIGGMQPLKAGRTYGFMLLRGNSIKHKQDRRYMGIFCIERQSDGHFAYLPYVTHPDGTITYPRCGSYIGAPPAPDGIVPKDSP